MTQHPMQPPPKLVRDLAKRFGSDLSQQSCVDRIVCLAYAAGADAQLRRDEKWLVEEAVSLKWANELRAAMRPKPPSLKQQALEQLSQLDFGAPPQPEQLITIRRALEGLPDDH